MSRYQISGPETSSGIDTSWSSVIAGVRYKFRLKYRQRFDSWTLAIADAKGSPIIDGMSVVEGVDMLEPFTDVALPPGSITCVDTRGLGAAPTRYDWKDRHILVYEDPTIEDEDNGLASYQEPA